MGQNDTLNQSLRADPTYQAALRGEWGKDQFPTGPDGRVLPGFRPVAARYYAEAKQSGGTYDQPRVNEMYQGEGNARTIDPKTGEWSSPNKTNWYDPQYLGPAVVGGIATGGLLSAGGAFGGAASAAVPGSTAAQALVPTTVGGLTTPGVGMAATTMGTAGTAGAAGTAGSILSRVGNSKFLTGASDVLGGAAKSASQNNAINDANSVNLYNSEERNRLARDQFALNAPGTRMGQSTKASILSRVKPTTINWGGPGSGVRGQTPTTTGGFRDALANMDPAVGQLAQEVMQQNLAKQRANMDGVTVTPPKIGKSSFGDKALGAGAFGTSILSLLRR